MNKNIIRQSIGLALAITTSFTTFNSLADETTDKNVIVVTANQLEQNINDTLTDVEVIDRIDIERIQPQSFIDLLVNIAGIDTVQKGGPGQSISIFSRGTNSNQMLILIDGVRVGSATLGGKSVADISISQIERIEIVKGPRAALWGSDAIGGVIQIFTRRFTSNEYRVAVGIGSNGTREIDASVGFGDEKFSNTITYSKKDSDGIDAHIDAETDDDGFENDSISIRGVYNLDDNNRLDWLAQLDESETEYDSSFSNISSQDNYLWNIRYNHSTADWINQIAVSTSGDKNIVFGNGLSKADAESYETVRKQINYLSRYTVNESVSIAAGLDWIEDDISVSYTVYTETQRTTKSAYINTTYKKDSLLGEFAIRIDDVENVAKKTTINAGLGYRLDDRHQFSLNYGEGFKAPSFNDLYFPFGGNPDLKFETSTNNEFVYKGFYESGNLILTVYDSKIDNLIQWIPDTEGVWAPQNVGSADISGVDATFKIRSGSYQHKIIASYVKAEDGTTGNQLALRAKQHLGYDISYTGDSYDLFAQLQYVGERPDTDFQSFLPTMLDSYTQLNLGISYTFENNLQLKFKVSDAFDKAPVLASGYNSAGRQYYLSFVHQNLF